MYEFGNFVSEEAMTYSEIHTTPEITVLQKLNRHTHVNVIHPRMLSGHFQGKLLEMISRMISPRLILEVGTYTGYSAIALSQGLRDDGKLISLECNPEFAETAQRFIEEANLEHKIEVRIGQAFDLMEELNQMFDLVFIDADKENYLGYYEKILPHLRKGGVLIADNVLWSGKVFTNEMNNDKEALALHQFNGFVTQDERVENLLLPIRDGLMIVQKR